jgi:uncharacterized RDD family membrane protein YckC
MQMTTEARAWLHATVRRIMARHPLGEAERAGITYELMSHLHAAGEARATAAGRSEVTREDLEAALAEAGGDEGLADAFVQPLAKPMERVLFWRRLGAFAIDVFLLGIALTFVHNSLAFLLEPIYGLPQTMPVHAHNGLWRLVPWGFHGAGLAPGLQAIIAAASAAVVLAYFTWFEAREGRSLGKRALEIRVARVDGQPVTYRESFIRNVVKLVPLALIADTLIMLIVFPNAKQRLSDKIADTIVVRA